MRRVMRWISSLVLLMLLGYGALWWQNNRPAQPVPRHTVDAAFESSVQWLLARREQILRESNPMLWWMVGESARVSGDARLQGLYDEFLAAYTAQYPNSVWQVFFRPERYRNAAIPPDIYRNFVEYQQYFLYAATCSRSLVEDPLISAQNETNFCWRGTRIIRPACVTHQLMGFRLAQRNGCTAADAEQKIEALQNTLVRQLRYDPRVVDVYIQRVLMLVDSGAGQRVESRWLQRVLDAQLDDGGWSDMQPLQPLGGGRYWGFGANGMTVDVPTANFHATAQGVWLTSLLRR
jgi:hypothetical protein